MERPEGKVVRRGGKDGMQKNTFLCAFTSPKLLL